MFRKKDDTQGIKIIFKIIVDRKIKLYTLGVVDTVEDVLPFIDDQIERKSNIDSLYKRFWYDDPYIVVDYGAHNAWYLCENLCFTVDD